MTLEDLIAQFRSEVDDEQAQAYLWSAVEATRWANEAVREAAIRSKLIFDSTTASVCTIAVTTGTATYALDPSIHDIENVFLSLDGAVVARLPIKDRLELDRLNPDWRSTTARPTAVVRDDTSIQLNYLPDVAYTLQLEVYRVPEVDMEYDSDEPEISVQHHRHLVPWMKFRAYSKPDAETKDEAKAAQFEAEFTAIFGPRPDADQRRRQQANKPHFNKAVW